MGPLAGIKIIELAGIGPGPFCGMMLSDMGAEVIRIDRPAPGAPAPKDVLVRNRRSLAVDLKSEAGRETVLRLCEGADAIFEGFRPGVTERLGLGPEDCMARNPKLVYGRMTGWGQEGPMAQAAGHDINYIGLSGALHAIGRAGERPVPPLNLVGDFGGGGMLLAYGLVCGLLEAQRSGQGQVIDAAMVDGAAALMGMFFSFAAQGGFTDQRGTNLLDGAAHFSDTTLCVFSEQDLTFSRNLTYWDLNATNCKDLSSETEFFIFAQGQAITDASGMQTELELSWADLLEVVVWIFILLIIELSVKIQGLGVGSSAVLRGATAINYSLYGVLWVIAAYWAHRGHWLFAWDETLWILGFMAISTNLSDWRKQLSGVSKTAALD